MSLFLRLLSADWKQNGVRRNVHTVLTRYPTYKKDAEFFTNVENETNTHDSNFSL